MTDPGYRGIQEVKYGKSTNVLSFWLEIDGALATPTSATISIYKPGQGSPESTPIVSAASVAVDVTTKLMTYSVDASDTGIYALGESYRGEVDILVSSTHHYRTVIFDVVRQPIIHAIPCRVDDLYRVHAAFSQILTQQNEASTIHQFCLIPAWQEVLAWVSAQGRRPALVSPPESLQQITFNKFAEKACRRYVRSGDPNDIMTVLADAYAKGFEAAKATTVLRYDFGDQFQHDKDAGFQQPQFLTGNDPDTIHGAVLARRTPWVR